MLSMGPRSNRFNCDVEMGMRTFQILCINRLSDALFVFSRLTASTMNEKEFLWEPGKKDPEGWVGKRRRIWLFITIA